MKLVYSNKEWFSMSMVIVGEISKMSYIIIGDLWRVRRHLGRRKV